MMKYKFMYKKGQGNQFKASGVTFEIPYVQSSNPYQ